eukprot:TRINITY_DN4930_c0_g1_i1.p1 TRINITY_DN4930_c0_g1~~TRINITY_DN4930_c0_g1_i1.p1  ORF type:complete len:529 (+),score=126.69 TRINITY_DN4930_c0_g1_i1:196-1782(+)
MTRTYFYIDGTASDTVLGPEIRVKQGDTLNILLVNNLWDENGDSIGPEPPTVADYFKLIHSDDPNNPYVVKLPYFFGKPPATAEELIVDHTNMPKNFDITNLHLHGLEVEPHMYDPMGTLDPKAPSVTVKPGDCYCYKFKIPEHEPVGLYWYHPHYHTAVAIQMWSGMAGLLFVEPKDGKPEIENYDTSKDIIFPVWDPHFKVVEEFQGRSFVTVRDRIVTDDMISDQTGSSDALFMVGDVYQPEYTFQVGETRRIRILCATTENLMMFSIFKKGEESVGWDKAIPFFATSSDAVGYEPVEKTMIVMSGGQRQDVMVSFQEEGEYLIRSQGLSNLQFFGFGPPNVTLARIIVREKKDSLAFFPTVNDMKFRVGIPETETIDMTEIDHRDEITFNLFPDTRVAPFPQFHINGAPYHPDVIDFEGYSGTAIEYVITNPNQATHPFHVHVNRFQVKEMHSSQQPDNPVMQAMIDPIHPDIWRDTVTVPPFGSVRLWMRFGPIHGKTMLHCHFLAHEDTGMVSSLIIHPPKE